MRGFPIGTQTRTFPPNRIEFNSIKKTSIDLIHKRASIKRALNIAECYVLRSNRRVPRAGARDYLVNSSTTVLLLYYRQQSFSSIILQASCNFNCNNFAPKILLQVVYINMHSTRFRIISVSSWSVNII